MFLTPNDFAVLLRGIMNHKLLTRAETTSWMKPTAFTGSPTGSVGSPWAIIRSDNVPRASGRRPLEVYTMLGSFPTYAAYAAFIPEYEIGIAVNVAGTGDDPALRALLDLAVQNVIPLFDDLAREQAEAKYAGTYESESGDTLVLSIDDGPGLKVEEWTSSGKPVSDAYLAVKGRVETLSGVDVRAYPIVGTEHRWQVSFLPIHERELPGIFEHACDTWFNFGRMAYAGENVDQLRFYEDEEGNVGGIQVPGLRQKLVKV